MRDGEETHDFALVQHRPAGRAAALRAGRRAGCGRRLLWLGLLRAGPGHPALLLPIRLRRLLRMRLELLHQLLRGLCLSGGCRALALLRQWLWLWLRLWLRLQLRIQLRRLCRLRRGRSPGLWSRPALLAATLCRSAPGVGEIATTLVLA